MPAWIELKRRKIVQWGLAYLAGAWVALQLVSILADQFAWPVELERGTTILLAFGFFITLVLAWYHGEKGQQRVSGPELLMVAGILIVAGAAIAVARGEPVPGAASGVSALPDAEPAEVSGAERTSTTAASTVQRLDIILPDSAPLSFVGAARYGVGRRALAISPDGSHLAYVAQRDGSTRLYLRPIDRSEAVGLQGTEGAFLPFFSPDGDWIGFFAGGYLKKVSVEGGRPIRLTSVSDVFGATWGMDQRILLADQHGWRLSWLPAAGGVPQPIVEPRRRILYPQLLPGGEWVLHGTIERVLSLTSLRTGHRYVIESARVVPRESAEPASLVYGANPYYVDTGHIAYISGDGVLMVLPFDLETLRVAGPSVPIADGIRIEAQGGGAQFTVSREGTFVFAPGGNTRFSRFAWVDLTTGAVDTLPLPRATYGMFDLAPDGARILTVIEPPSAPRELWVFDISRGARRRVSTRVGMGGDVSWWPDGRSIVLAEYRPDGGSVMVRQWLGPTTDRDTLLSYGAMLAISPDGGEVVARGVFPSFSPDGKRLAFSEFTNGTLEVYVVAADRPDEPYRISTDGGEQSLWMPDGRSLLYRNGNEWLTVEVISSDGEIRPGQPRLFFRAPYLQVPGWAHDLSADGRRLLVLVGPPGETAQHLVVVTNWLREVERAAPRSEG